MSHNEEWSRWSREDLRMTAVKAVVRTEDQKGSRKTEDDGKVRREIAPGAILVVSKKAQAVVSPPVQMNMISQPLRALCFRLARYRLNRLFLICGSA